MKAVKPKHMVRAVIFLTLTSPFMLLGAIANLIIISVKVGFVLAKKLVDAI